MFDFLISSFKKGLRQIKDNLQLAYTLFVAVIIFFAFLFISNNFFLIAKNAQDRLINVRIGSIQDVFSEFILEYINEPEELSEKIENVAKSNKTIEEFKVVIFEDNQKKIIASLDSSDVGKQEEDNFLYNIAIADPGQSFTIEETTKGKRFFRTIRIIEDEEGRIIGAINTKQSLSEADQIISRSITNGIITLVVVLFFIMILFFRHAKIIDYVSLYRRLESVNQMKDDFISMASHELRTPLTIIRGYAEILKTSKEIKEEEKNIANNIDIHSKRLGILIDDILDISRIEQGKIKFNLEKFNPKKEIEETIESLKYSAKEKELKLYSNFESLAIIFADRDRLRQILVNIIGNSIKYTKEGEIKIKTSTDNKNFYIRVSDTGMGMSAEEQKGLFQKFYRIKSKETESIMGTGLGLWITKELIQLMKGNISVESIKGVGTHMIISFPIQSKELG